MTDPTSTSAPLPTHSAAARRLMEAATDAFAAKGFHATTTRDIASRAGLSPAGVYVHFASKEALLYELSLSGHRAALALMQEAADADDPTDALRAMVAGFSTWHAENSRVARIVQYEFGHLTPQHRSELVGLRKEIDGTVRRVIEAGVSRGDFEVEDIPTTTLALLSLAVDLARWFSPGKHQSAADIGAAYGALALRLVRAR